MNSPNETEIFVVGVASNWVRQKGANRKSCSESLVFSLVFLRRILSLQFEVNQIPSSLDYKKKYTHTYIDIQIPCFTYCTCLVDSIE